MEPKLCTCLSQPPQKRAFWNSASRVGQIQEPETRSQLYHSWIHLLKQHLVYLHQQIQTHPRWECETWACLLPADPCDSTIRYPKVTSPPSTTRAHGLCRSTKHASSKQKVNSRNSWEPPHSTGVFTNMVAKKRGNLFETPPELCPAQKWCEVQIPGRRGEDWILSTFCHCAL